MINLLPAEDQRQLAAAQTNTLLLRYLVLLPIVILLLIAEMGAIYLVMNTTQNNNRQTIADNESKAAQYDQLKTEASDFRTNLRTAKSILDTQVPYSDILTSIAQVLPDGASLETFLLDSTTLTTPTTTFKVRVQSYPQAVEVKNQLQNAKINDENVFTDVNILETSHVLGDDDHYEATYNVTFSKEILP